MNPESAVDVAPGSPHQVRTLDTSQCYPRWFPLPYIAYLHGSAPFLAIRISGAAVLVSPCL